MIVDFDLRLLLPDEADARAPMESRMQSAKCARLSA